MHDPKALASGGAGGGLALAGTIGINEWAAIVGIITAIITCGVYVWSVRKRIEMQKTHNRKVRDIQRGKDESEDDS